MNNIKAIGFDWGGVIFLYPGGNFNPAAAHFLGIPKEEFSAVYFKHNHMANKGPNAKTFEEAHEMWSNILTELGLEDRHSAFMEFVRARQPGYVDERMVGLIGTLKAAGWKLGLLSNMSLSGAEKARETDLEKLFDVTLFSAELGYMKPEPEAFQALARGLGVDPSQMVFIDDSKRSLSTSGEVGYTPIFYTGYDGLVARLHELKIL